MDEMSNLTTVALNLCSHCLAGCTDHPNLHPHRCRTEGCALNDATIPYEGLGRNTVELVLADVVELVNAAQALCARFGHSPGPFDDVLWGGTVERTRAALQPFIPAPPPDLPVERIKDDPMVEREAAARLQEAMAKR
jgi:hypothetical protein